MISELEKDILTVLKNLTNKLVFNRIFLCCVFFLLKNTSMLLLLCLDTNIAEDQYSSVDDIQVRVCLSLSYNLTRCGNDKCSQGHRKKR
jgi:phosphate starvation-inducible membrane PsiE